MKKIIIILIPLSLNGGDYSSKQKLEHNGFNEEELVYVSPIKDKLYHWFTSPAQTAVLAVVAAELTGSFLKAMDSGEKQSKNEISLIKPLVFSTIWFCSVYNDWFWWKRHQEYEKIQQQNQKTIDQYQKMVKSSLNCNTL